MRLNRQTVRDIDLKGKTVLVRVDYNVPIEKGVVGDTLRIKASFDTIKYLLGQHCRIILMSHLGRPEGKVDNHYSLAPVAAKASEMLGKPINFVNKCVGPEVTKAAEKLERGEILLLENLRFHPEEEANDAEFAKKWADLAEVYVDDAFAVIHRAHASTEAITHYLPAVAGLLVEKEVDTITAALNDPARPLAAVIGGAKISTKIEVLSALLKRVDSLIIGGAMANTFLAAEGQDVGKSIYEPDQADTARRIVAEAKEAGIEIILPTDAVITEDVASRHGRTVTLAEVGPKDLIVDLGPATVHAAGKLLDKAGTIIWNGPVGIAETPAFAGGTRALARTIMESHAKSIIGGGDTAAYVDEAGWHDKFSFVSTGGGASLDLIAGKKLPGVEALLKK